MQLPYHGGETARHRRFSCALLLPPSWLRLCSSRARLTSAAAEYPEDMPEPDEEYVVGRVGSSPLPGDRRRCAYLVLGTRGPRPPDGSS